MKTNDKPATASLLSPQQDYCAMPGEFAGMYQSGFEAGYQRGHETGYDKGFAAGMAVVRQGPKNGAAPTAAVEGKPAPKTGRGACSLACHARNVVCI